VATSGTATPTPGVTLVSSTNVAGVNVYPLPTNFLFGESFIVLGYTGGAGWKITQGAGQQVFQGGAISTLGSSGYVVSQTTSDNAIFACVDNTSTTFTVVASSGNCSFY
jgi:hypothetical protein